MTDLFKGLNDGQAQAVAATEGAVLVLSGAGTGKTRVLITRIAHILQSGLAQPWQILALTFTNKAAGEMKARLRGMIGDLSEGVWMGTFHSVGLRILRAHAEVAGLKNPFVILNDDDQKAVVKIVVNNLGLDIKKFIPADIADKISFMKDTGRSSLGSPELDKIFEVYQAELTRMNAVDFGDLIIKPIKLLIDSSEILQKYQRQFKYVLVDEYQDTNASQYQLMRLLASGHNNICCVGDDDQSIYSWRGSEVKNILNFADHYKGAKIVRLEKNYRSTSAILGAAGSIIKNNKDRLGKELRAAKVGGDADAASKVQIARVWSDRDEARAIADAIASHIDNGGRWSDNAVLIRSAALSRLFEEEFVLRKMPYRLVGGTKFYDRTEIKDAIAYARLLVYPFDDVSFARVFNQPRRGLGDVALANVRDFARRNHLSCMDALYSMDFSPRMAKAATEFAKLFQDVRDLAENLTPAEVLQSLLDRSGYLKMWQESKELDAKERLDRIRELIGMVSDADLSLSEFLEQAALMSSAEEGEDPKDAISVMTIHAAKGLEFPNVFLPAWEEGVFPNERALGESGQAGLEEERRLAYVAITRAIDRCIISCTGSRLVFGQRQNNQPSMFIDEIDGQFVDKIGFYAQSEKPKVKSENLEYKKQVKKLSMIGKMVEHSDLGKGVVIELDGEVATIAFRDAGIKKVDVKFLK